MADLIFEPDMDPAAGDRHDEYRMGLRTNRSQPLPYLSNR